MDTPASGQRNAGPRELLDEWVERQQRSREIDVDNNQLAGRYRDVGFRAPAPPLGYLLEIGCRFVEAAADKWVLAGRRAFTATGAATLGNAVHREHRPPALGVLQRCDEDVAHDATS